MSKVRTLVVSVVLLASAPAATFSGSFVNADLVQDLGMCVGSIIHPHNYIPGEPVTTTRICIDPASPNREVMQAPVERAIATWTALQPTTGGCSNCVGHLDGIPP